MHRHPVLFADPGERREDHPDRPAGRQMAALGAIRAGGSRRRALGTDFPLSQHAQFR